ncbi:dinucleotide-utilizing enzyme [Microbacterium sp. SLBN-146]|uniref:dinucleotide-utilizing enzyme n=1 Tax=Microbacterium sp. SLBN-146 TaxID=2768457 RepID=UPI00114E78E6|nr:dinucleotide-utilizing enzyme [Microbacterium sp. SLBN-146]TQJ32303.1 hypothetical protein FBY39_2809 [Microbacterium sp. SLBN-146]
MTARPRIERSIPFWGLLAVSVASAAVGAWIMADRLGTMSTALLDGTATGVEVYVGQSLAVVGAVLVGAGVVGILLLLAVATAASLRPAAEIVVVPVTEDVDEVDIDVVDDLDEPRDAETDAEPTPVR